MEYIGGKQLIIESLKSGHKIYKIYFQNQLDKDIVILTRKSGIVVERISKKLELKKEFSQGLLAEVEDYSYADLEDTIKNKLRGVLLILNHLEDPHNLGAIIRTALCGGVIGIIIPDDRSVKVNSTVLKVSAGAAYYLPIIKVKNINQTIKLLKEKDFWIYGADMNGGVDLFQVRFDGLIGLVIGNEGRGLSMAVKENCDEIVSIPQVGELGSLNVSVATGVIIYEILRQREF